MLRPPPRSTRSDTLLPYTTRFRSQFHITPEVIAGEADVLPANGRRMAEQCIVDIAALPSKIICRSPQIDGVPQDDRRRYEIEARGRVPLIFNCATPELPKPIKE